ncbi:MAG: hypothetical protein ACNA7I_03585 [Candidatus Methanoperedens sp.]
MMTWDFEVPGIRYSILTSEGHGGHEEDGEPYNDNSSNVQLLKELLREEKGLSFRCRYGTRLMNTLMTFWTT